MACCIQIEDHIIEFIKRIETEIGQIGQIGQNIPIFQNQNQTKKKFGPAIYLPVAEVKRVN